MSDLTCFSCRDGNTPLYCLNCADDILKTELTTLRSQVEKLTGERDSAIARVHALEEIGFDPRTRQLTQERYQAHARLNEARDLLGDAIAHPGKNSEWGSRRDTWLKGTP